MASSSITAYLRQALVLYASDPALGHDVRFYANLPSVFRGPIPCSVQRFGAVCTSGRCSLEARHQVMAAPTKHPTACYSHTLRLGALGAPTQDQGSHRMPGFLRGLLSNYGGGPLAHAPPSQTVMRRDRTDPPYRS